MDYSKLKMLSHFNRLSLLIINVVAWKQQQTGYVISNIRGFIKTEVENIYGEIKNNDD